ncbi:hypothetical protein FIBSPDRAFT_863457 [Athelia psychrophila]|uniref:Membrane-associated proteins in eicosanoid and glutathione metabolism n=1 Tax=Athelia psychrophila TaxID=1759441 RepID=A0A166HAY8_9AGAM|nr:hypothetical protein FIBSPDRAFT_863457 [Fibularhizoctonia sp. CBS 109695]
MSTNYSILAIPGAWIVTLAPHIFAAGLLAKNVPWFDGANPRHCLGELASTDKENAKNHAVKLQILRAKAAEANGFENLPVFVGAVLAANFVGVPVETLNTLSAAYVASRVLYNIVYVNVTSKKYVLVRTLFYNIGAGIALTLYGKAFYAMNK